MIFGLVASENRYPEQKYPFIEFQFHFFIVDFQDYYESNAVIKAILYNSNNYAFDQIIREVVR
jgi:hypothetical protein